MEKEYTITCSWLGNYTIQCNTFTSGHSNPYTITCSIDTALHIAETKIKYVLQLYNVYLCHSVIKHEGKVIDGYFFDKEINNKINRMTEKELLESNFT